MYQAGSPGYSACVEERGQLRRDARMYLSRRLNHSLAPPDMVSVNVTLRCNLKCTMCTTCYDEANELTTDEIKSIIDQTSLMGVSIFNPLGGEPFVRRDLEELLTYACRRDFYITVTTNGTLITRDRAEVLARIPTDRLHFNISLDGPQPIHDDIRGAGQYERALRGYRAIRDADERAGNPPRKILANTLIHRCNWAELPGFLDEQAEMGFDGVQLLNLFRHGKGDPTDPGDLWFWEKDLPGLENLVEDLVGRVQRQGRSGYRILNPVEDLQYIPAYYRDHLVPLEAPCWSGWKELYINADGQAIMCDGQLEFLKGTFGDIRRQTLQEIWHSSELRQRREVVKNCSTPCMQNCYLRRPSDSARKIMKGAASLALDEVRQQIRRRRRQGHGLELPDGVLTLELSDTAPWFGEQHRTARRHFEDLVADSPSPFERCYQDPFEFYEYRNRGYLRFDRGFMGLEVVRSVVEDLLAAGMHFGTLQLSWRGEPLLHPEFVLVLRHLLETMERTRLFGQLVLETDGRLLNTEIADVASFHGTVPQTWVIRGEGIDPFQDEVLHHVDYLLRVRRPAQRVVASWTVSEEWDPHFFVETWGPRLKHPWKVAGRLPAEGDGLWFRRTDHDHFQANAAARERLEEVAQVLGIPCDSGDESLPRRCPGALATPVVSWDGKVTLCPWDTSLHNKVGEVTSDRFSRLWTREATVLEARREARSKGVPGGDLCRDCHYVYSSNYRMARPGELDGG